MKATIRVARLPSGHWGIDHSQPVYEFVAEHRRKMGLTGGRYAKRMGLKRSAHYAFEAAENKSYDQMAAELQALGYEVTIIAERKTL